MIGVTRNGLSEGSIRPVLTGHAFEMSRELSVDEGLFKVP
jgi:hypothetical protein